MTTEEEIYEIKTIRRDLDESIQEIKAMPESRERCHAITKLQEAVMWLGMALKAINEQYPQLCPNPYPEGKNPESLKIEPTADGLKL